MNAYSFYFQNNSKKKAKLFYAKSFIDAYKQAIQFAKFKHLIISMCWLNWRPNK